MQVFHTYPIYYTTLLSFTGCHQKYEVIKKLSLRQRTIHCFACRAYRVCVCVTDNGSCPEWGRNIPVLVNDVMMTNGNTMSPANQTIGDWLRAVPSPQPVYHPLIGGSTYSPQSPPPTYKEIESTYDQLYDYFTTKANTLLLPLMYNCTNSTMVCRLALSLSLQMFRMFQGSTCKLRTDEASNGQTNSYTHV